MKNQLNIKPTTLKSEDIINLNADDFLNAEKIIKGFLKSNKITGFETIAKKGSLILLLKNNDQLEGVSKILKEVGLEFTNDKLLKLSLTVKLNNSIDELKCSKTNVVEPLTKYSSFE